MAAIDAELSRVQDAYAQPTLTLLGKSTAPVVVALFRTAFGRDTQTVSAARLHDRVEALLGELRATVDPKFLPTGTGKDLCRRWMRDQWLILTNDDAGNEVYTLSSHTQQALRLVESLTRDRAGNLSEHRIATIMNHLRRFNSEVNPDVAERVTILNEEIARLARERDRLVDGGEIEPVSDDRLLEGFVEAQLLLGGLPGDFSRVVEAFSRFRTQKIDEFNREDVTSGVVVKAYLSHVDGLAATPEGRAFNGAFQLLRDDDQLATLRSDIEALLNHPRTADILDAEDRAELASTVSMVNDGLKRVLDQRARSTSTLRDYISRHDVTRDRELATVLRNLELELTGWMKTAGPRTRVPVELIPGRLDVAHLRERFYDPAEDVALAPLAQADGPSAAPTLEELRLRGGPSHLQLRTAIENALMLADEVTLASVFNALPDDLRRPVEVLGLFPLTHSHGMEDTGQTEVLDTVRPDGTRRRLRVPQYVSTIATDDTTAPESTSGATSDDEGNAL